MAATRELLPGVTGVLALADGTVLQGVGVGAVGEAVGEVCFNTAMTGYQEILTDPSYMAQIVAFTFPHVGNVGTNLDDREQMPEMAETAARGAVFRDAPTAPANWRADTDLPTWMARRGVIGIAGVDTRALTRKIREHGMPHGVIAHHPEGRFDLEALVEQARAWSGLVGLDLAKAASCLQPFVYDEGLWSWPEGYAEPRPEPKYEVVVVDYGIKRNILRMLAEHGCRVTVVPATASAEDILRHRPDGIFLSNGPGDPAATGQYAVPVLRELIASRKPVFGICLGHQMLALALGGMTYKLDKGHRGANHPVKDRHTGKVEITSQNHGFAVDPESLPPGVEATHISLFDRTNEGLEVVGLPVFSVQHHPEASPGPQDSHYLFRRFLDAMAANAEDQQ